MFAVRSLGFLPPFFIFVFVWSSPRWHDSYGEPVYPVVVMFIAERVEVLFEFLVDTFCLAIALGMISSGEGGVNLEGGEEGLEGAASELRASVGDQAVGESGVGEDLFNEQICCAVGVDGLCSWAKEHSFGESVEPDVD